MSDLTVIHLKNCDTCRKAIKALTLAGHSLTLTDVRADGVTTKQVEAIAESVGWEAVLNTRSTTWRGLDAAQKDEMNATKAVALIVQYPTLMKRPAISDGKNTTVGWAKAQQETWL